MTMLLWDQEVNVSHLMLMQGHALVGGSGRDTSQLFKFSLFPCQIHANELMYINYAYCMKDTHHPQGFFLSAVCPIVLSALFLFPSA